MASSLFFQHRIMLEFVSNPKEDISLGFSSLYQQEWEREQSEDISYWFQWTYVLDFWLTSY